MTLASFLSGLQHSKLFKPVALGAMLLVGGGLVGVWHFQEQTSRLKQLQTAQQEIARLNGNVCTDTTAPLIGLRGEYFAGAQWAAPLMLTRIDRVLDFSGDFGLTQANLSDTSVKMQSPGSVRWKGWLKPFMSGIYRFHVTPASARVTLAKQVMTGPEANPPTLQLSAGRYYPILVEIPEVLVGQGFRLEWTLPHGTRGTIPQASLIQPNDSTKIAQPLRYLQARP